MTNHSYTIYVCGLFFCDFNLAVWQIFISLPNLDYAILYNKLISTFMALFKFFKWLRNQNKDQMFTVL